jgi:hypothetical protein
MEYFISSHHWLDALTPPLEYHIKNLADKVQLLLEKDKNVSSTVSQHKKIDMPKEKESFGEAYLVTERWIKSGYQYYILEGISKELKALITNPPNDINITDTDVLNLLMIAAIHFGGNWNFWIQKNPKKTKAIELLIQILNISYDRPRFRVLVALQDFNKTDINHVLDKMGNEVHTGIKTLIDKYVLPNKVQEYLLKIKKGDEPDIAKKAAVVLREISHYYGTTSGEDNLSGMPLL